MTPGIRYKVTGHVVLNPADMWMYPIATEGDHFCLPLGVQTLPSEKGPGEFLGTVEGTLIAREIELWPIELHLVRQGEFWVSGACAKDSPYFLAVDGYRVIERVVPD